MPTTLNAEKFGVLQGNLQGSQAGAHGVATSAAVINNPTEPQAGMVAFRGTSGRGSSFQYTRTFIKVDCSGLTGTTDHKLLIPSVAGGSSERVYAVKGVGAFDGEGGNLQSNNFDNLSLTTLFGPTGGNVWSGGNGGTNTISLNAAFTSAFNSNDEIQIALITELDFEDETLEEPGNITNLIGFASEGPIIRVTFEPPAAAGYNTAQKINGLLISNTEKIIGKALADIEKVSGL